MVTPPAALQPHLVAEVINILQLREDGDALLKLGLSGKLPFQRFVNTIRCNYGISHDTDVVVVYITAKNGNGVHRLFEPILRCSKQTLEIVANFTLVIDIYDCWKNELRPIYGKNENLTDLLLGGALMENLPVVQLLKLFPRLEALTILESAKFLEGFKNGEIQLDHLVYLELHLKPEELHDLMTMEPPFPFPETAVFGLYAKNIVPNVTNFKTFPQVKKFEMALKFRYSIKYDLFPQLPAILQCFPSIGTSSIEVACEHYYSTNDSDDRKTLYNILQDAKFHVKINMEYSETVDLDEMTITAHIYENLKSIGFTERDYYKNLTQTKDFTYVHLVHNINHIDFSGSSDIDYNLDDDYQHDSWALSSSQDEENLDDL
uniref:DUF38 domain-containing protein n=1 Tax=Panagrellus redivivus TaxID=6233 RepID=A0A7E4W6H2_PANRE